MSFVIREHVKKVVCDFGSPDVPDIFQGGHCKVIRNSCHFDENDEKTTHYRFEKTPEVRMQMFFTKPLPAACTHLSLVGVNRFPKLHEGLKYLELIDFCDQYNNTLCIPATVNTVVLRKVNIYRDIPGSVTTLNTDLESRAGRNVSPICRLGSGPLFRTCPLGVENLTLLVNSLKDISIPEDHWPHVIIANCSNQTTPRELYKKFKGCRIYFHRSTDLEEDYDEYLEHRAAKRAAKKRRLEQ